mmetsp:Transcript_48703/g.110295  ORF Transcript_48703/g.110295 Transcript_48703/m.110295 type:complete len:200 (-) Transcript_48703:14-613(-)
MPSPASLSEHQLDELLVVHQEVFRGRVLYASRGWRFSKVLAQELLELLLGVRIGAQGRHQCAELALQVHADEAAAVAVEDGECLLELLLEGHVLLALGHYVKEVCEGHRALAVGRDGLQVLVRQRVAQGAHEDAQLVRRQESSVVLVQIIEGLGEFSLLLFRQPLVHGCHRGRWGGKVLAPPVSMHAVRMAAIPPGRNA